MDSVDRIRYWIEPEKVGSKTIIRRESSQKPIELSFERGWLRILEHEDFLALGKVTHIQSYTKKEALAIAEAIKEIVK